MALLTVPEERGASPLECTAALVVMSANKVTVGEDYIAFYRFDDAGERVGEIVLAEAALSDGESADDGWIGRYETLKLDVPGFLPGVVVSVVPNGAVKGGWKR